MCTQCTLYSSSVHIFCCFYLYNVHIKECSFDIFDKPILQVQQQKELRDVEIQEQTASLTNIFFKLPMIFVSVNEEFMEKYNLNMFSNPSFCLSMLGAHKTNQA